MDPDQKKQAQLKLSNALKEYFDRDDQLRFKWEDHVGQGHFSAAWKIKYFPRNAEPAPAGPIGSGVWRRWRARQQQRVAAAKPKEWRRIVLKALIADTEGNIFGVDDMDIVKPGEEAGKNADAEPSISKVHPQNTQITREKSVLGAKHIVKLADVPRDPLAQTFVGLPRLPLNDGMYVYMEWIENGSLDRLITRIRRQGLEILPNRILWRFIMCLIRMCIAMAWPPPRPAGDNPQPVLEHVNPNIDPSGLVQDDFHPGNIMLGSLEDDPGEPEHSLVPILKLIDFGISKELAPLDPKDKALTRNIFDIGTIMASLVLLRKDLPFDYRNRSLSNSGKTEPFKSDITAGVEYGPEGLSYDPTKMDRIPCRCWTEIYGT
ncbi:Uu.00g117880.m01.CDS01 [Anthostomella pinea]|uniref:Uu.00g117880.m01.CDS01 n=1 Tax=Anthostomella pinea TaxID=933095 RepID=A0AAI8YGZ0_9PEZI|nr:Uu.00g117880.m01.CDS01 [Anthostomella pinea]